MSVLQKIAYFQQRRDEVPNQELAKILAETQDHAGIREIADNLWHDHKSVQSDCLKVLYEIGYIAPELIENYLHDFLKLLRSKNNRLIWGSMIALFTIAPKKAHDIWPHIDDVIHAVENGTVITVVSGVKTLAFVAAADRIYNDRLFPIMLDILRTCIPRDVPTHGESMLCAVDEINRSEFVSVLTEREPEMNTSQRKRLGRLFKKMGNAA